MTSRKAQELRIDLQQFSGAKAYAKYSTFSIADEKGKYRLKVGGYSGTAGEYYVLRRFVIFIFLAGIDTHQMYKYIYQYKHLTCTFKGTVYKYTTTISLLQRIEMTVTTVPRITKVRGGMKVVTSQI